MSIDKRSLTSRYAQIASAQSGEKIETETTNNSPYVEENPKKTGMPLVEIAYRRLLVTEPFNQKARYYVALVLERQGQISQARSLMQQLAPINTAGFTDAHSWLVRDTIRRAQKFNIPIPEKEFLHHLNSNATSSNADPDLLVLLSSILEREGKLQEAEKHLEKASTISPQFAINLSSFYKRNSKLDLQLATSKRAQTYFESELKRPEIAKANKNYDELFSQLGLSLILQERFDEAIQKLSEELSQNKTSLKIRNTLSSAYAFRFQKQLSGLSSLDNLNLSDLETSIGLCPENPVSATLISQLLLLQSENNTAIKTMLEKNITQGASSSIVHLLLANEAILGNRFHEAVPHLEIALSHQPGNPTILNNLALAVVSNPPPDVNRALSLIDQAISISGESAELMDTKGQILAIAGKELEAIRCFEKAVADQPARIKTRERLIELFEKQNMTSMAVAQKNAISFIKSKIREIEATERQGKSSHLPPFCLAPDLNSSPPRP